MKKEKIFYYSLYFLFLLIIVKYYNVQIRHGKYYEEMATKNHIRQVIVPAYRGTIYSKEGIPMAKNEEDYDLKIYIEEAKEPENAIKELSLILQLRKEEILNKWKQKDVNPTYMPISLITSLEPEELPLVEELRIKHSAFSISKTLKRDYPFSEYSAHVIGYVGEVSSQELKEKKGLRIGEWIGKSGIERAYDERLKGIDEIWQVVVDSKEKEVQRFLLRKGKVGNDLKTSISLSIQKKARDLFGERKGAAVMLNVKNGECVLYYSSPSKKILPPISSKAKLLWKELMSDPSNPLLDRVSQGLYPPGSIFKVILATGSLEEGIWDENKTIICNGSFKFGDRIFKCWKKNGHGTVNLKKAIKESCDVFFYNLGLQMGLNRIEKWGRVFEIDKTANIDLPYEKKGFVPSEEWSLKVRGVPWFAGETVSLSIGQGPVLVTPLKIAQIYSLFATSGKIVYPKIIKDGKANFKELKISKKTIEFLREALKEVVESPSGTAHKILSPLKIAGKTGTAQVMSEEKGKPYIKEHSWFVGYAPEYDPIYVCAVIVENAGHGSEVAAPIVKELLEFALK